MMDYTDEERVEIARAEYDIQIVGEELYVKNDSKKVGTVEKIYDDDVTLQL